MNATKTLRQVIGEAVRRLREAEGKRQDDLAKVARDRLGLAWRRTKIAALERGEKSISAEELLLLPVLLGWALDRPRSVPWSELLSGPGDIALTDSTRIAVCDVAALFDDTVDATGLVRLTKQPAKRPGRGALSLDQVFGRLRDLDLKTDYDRFEEIQRRSGETEVRAARRVGEHYAVLNAISAELWGRSVGAERDARVAATAPPEATAASLRAHRGRITRELDDEVRQFVAARVSSDKPEDDDGAR